MDPQRFTKCVKTCCKRLPNGQYSVLPVEAPPQKVQKAKHAKIVKNFRLFGIATFHKIPLWKKKHKLRKKMQILRFWMMQNKCKICNLHISHLL